MSHPLKFIIFESESINSPSDDGYKLKQQIVFGAASLRQFTPLLHLLSLVDPPKQHYRLQPILKSTTDLNLALNRESSSLLSRLKIQDSDAYSNFWGFWSLQSDIVLFDVVQKERDEKNTQGR